MTIQLLVHCAADVIGYNFKHKLVKINEKCKIIKEIKINAVEVSFIVS